MFSYLYQLRTMLFSSPAPPQPSKPQPPHPQQQPVYESQDRILETIREDFVTFDYLTFVTFEYSPTEKHKKCTGLKIDPVQQISMFIQTLRDKSIPIETSLHTLHMPSAKKAFWIRVSLADLTELSLEPLWMIKGRVQLYSKQQWVTITIDGRSLEPCFLDPQSQLLFSQPDRNWRDEFLRLAKEGLTVHDQEKRDSDDSDDDYDGDDHHSNNSKREEPHEEYNEDRVQTTQKHKMCQVKDDVSDIAVSHKKRKAPVRNSHVSEEKKQKKKKDAIHQMLYTQTLIVEYKPG